MESQNRNVASSPSLVLRQEKAWLIPVCRGCLVAQVVRPSDFQVCFGLADFKGQLSHVVLSFRSMGSAFFVGFRV